jgi:hypothetical protein
VAVASRTVAPTTEDAQHALQVAQAVQQMYLDAEDSLFQSLADHLWRAARGAAVTEGRQKRLEAMRERLDKGNLTDRQRRELTTDLRTLAKGGADPRMVRTYLERRSKEIKELRREASRIIQRLERRAFPTLVEAATAAWRRGVRSAIDDINDLGGRKGIPAGQGVVEMARQMIKNLRRRHISALRTIDDQFQEVNAAAIGRALTGAETIDQVVERELRDYARRGVTRFVDRAGKTWDLPTYAEMTARTSVIRAASDGHTRTLAANGHQFVIVSRDAITCSRCAPFEGEILAIADDGPTGEVEVTHFLTDEPMTIEVRSTIEFARRLGLQHPNCGHTFGLYTPGVTQRPARPPSTATYEDAQQQRRLERELRAAKRIAAVARTPKEQKDARARAKKVSAQLDELAETKGLPRRRRQERVRDLQPEEVDAARQSRATVARETRSARRTIERASQRTAAAGTRGRRPPPSTGGAPMDGGPSSGGPDGSPSGGGGAPAGPRGSGPGPAPLQEAQRLVDDAPQAADEVRPSAEEAREQPPPADAEDQERDDADRPVTLDRAAAQQQARDAVERARSRTQDQRPATTEPRSDAGERTETQQAARDAAAQARTRSAAERARRAEPAPAQAAESSLWSRDLPDPADRPAWYSQEERDDRQIITEPDGSQVVVIAGEIVGRLRQSQTRPGQWFGQHTDRSQVNRRATTQEQAVEELIRQAEQRRRANHDDRAGAPAADPDAAAREAQTRYDQVRAARDELASRVEELREQLDDPDSDRDADEVEQELEEAEAELQRRSRAVGEAAEQVRQARDGGGQRAEAPARPARTRRRDADPAAAQLENREMGQLTRNVREAAAERRQAEQRLEEAERAAVFTRQYRPTEQADAERALVRARANAERTRQRAEEAAAAMREQRDALMGRRFGAAAPIERLERIRQEAPVRAEFGQRRREEEARLQQEQQAARDAMAGQREQAEQALADARQRVRAEEARLQEVASAERERLREQGITGAAARRQVRDAVQPLRGALTAAEEAERAARRAVAAAEREQQALDKRLQQEERQLRAELDRQMRAALPARAVRPAAERDVGAEEQERLDRADDRFDYGSKWEQ